MFSATSFKSCTGTIRFNSNRSVAILSFPLLQFYTNVSSLPMSPQCFLSVETLCFVSDMFSTSTALTLLCYGFVLMRLSIWCILAVKHLCCLFLCEIHIQPARCEKYQCQSFRTQLHSEPVSLLSALQPDRDLLCEELVHRFQERPGLEVDTQAVGLPRQLLHGFLHLHLEYWKQIFAGIVLDF